MNHSARSHLLESFRAELAAKGLPEARAVSRMRDGRRVDYAGIVFCRQRPGKIFTDHSGRDRGRVRSPCP